MWGKKRSLVIFLLVSASLQTAAWAVVCPQGWSNFPSDATKCRPNLPSTDYYNDPSDLSYQRAVCGMDAFGTGRIPVLPSFEPMAISTKSYPNSSMQYSSGGVTVLTARSTDGGYLYETLSRCVCMGAPAVAPTPSASALPQDDTVHFSSGNFPSGIQRVFPDTFDVIDSQDQEAHAKYSMVAYAASPDVDGRIGENFRTGLSRCGCPNINEHAVINGSPSGLTGIMGSHCEPLLDNSYGRVLTTYSSAIHNDATTTPYLGTQVATVANEGLTGTTVVERILIPTNVGGSQTYDRKIWTCAPPYKTDFTQGKCVPPTSWADHACSSAGIPSPVSPSVTGADAVSKFNNTINKKLACCMNEYSGTGGFIKFDCVDNSTTSYPNFNTLWTSSDSGVDGGQSNAIVLAGALGKYLTGFYTIDGVRCDEFSEFADSYEAKRLTRNNNGGWDPQPVAGSASIIPPASMKAMITSLTPLRTVPTTGAQMKRCPILARAATVVTCPVNPTLPVVQKTFEDSSVSPVKKHCSSAASIQVHIRIEQIFEIEGMPKMKTVDTVAEQRLASSISIDKIIASKSNACPGGTMRQGDVCVYH